MQLCSETSVLGRKWVLPDSSAEAPVSAPSGVPKESAAVAVRRGVSNLESFFDPTLKAYMPDPLRLKAMDAAVSRVADAIALGQKICVYGDYDVDGATSSALLLRWFRMIGHANACFYIPNRMLEGYGPNKAAIEKLRADEAVDLVMVVDSGTTSVDPITRAREIGMDTIIIDHHEPGDDGVVAPGILVNPKCHDDDRQYSYMCTAGLVFLFLVGLQRHLRQSGYFGDKAITEPDLRTLLGIVALGTVADMVPLIDLNRAYVQQGLSRLDCITGIRALAVANGEMSYTTRSLGFGFGPCINAAGRISDTRLGTQLLISDDDEEAAALAKRLVELNVERRDIQRKATEEAIEMIRESGMAERDNVIIAYNQEWHPGVVGLIATKVKDEFDKPAIVIGEDGKGSCRSVDGFDIGKCVIQAWKTEGLLLKGGGHTAAAGLTVDPARIDELRSFMNEKAAGFEKPSMPVDLAFECGSITASAVEGIGRLAPFGQGNKEPTVAISGGFARSVRIFQNKHIKVVLTGRRGTTEVMSFNAVGTRLGEALSSCEGQYVDIIGMASIDTYGGNLKVVIKASDAMIGRSLEDAAA